MADHVGITNKFGLTTPTGGYAHSTSRKSTREIGYVKNESGVTVEVFKQPFQKRDISMRGEGSPDFSLVTAGVVASGTLKIHQMKEDQTNKGVPSFEITAEAYNNDA